MKRHTLVLWTLAKVVMAVLLLVWFALQLRRFDAYFALSMPLWIRGIGFIFLIAGGLLVLLCGAILSTRGILAKPGDRLFPSEFVAFGPFRYTRNPMSLGIVIFMLGLALRESSTTILLFALVLFLCLHLIVVFVEEPGLERRFGESYRLYKQSVNRWLPRFRRSAP